MRNQMKPFVRAAGLLVAVALTAAACTGSATVTETGSSTNSDAAEPTRSQGSTTAPVEPTTVSEPPTAVPADPTAVPTMPLAVEDFRTDNIVGISNGGVYAYAGTTSPWDNATACDAVASESLAGVDIEAADQGDPAPFAVGLEQSGDVRQLLVGQASRVAILSSCGPPETPTVWVQSGELDDGGRLRSVGDPLPMGNEGERAPHLLRWVDAETIELRVIIEVDPDDAETWIVEWRQVSISTGEIISTTQFDFFDDDEFSARPELATPDGFIYRVIDDPGGSIGCEGFGVARTLELDNGNTRQVALTQPDLVASSIDGLHIGPSGYIAWTSGCEGFVSAFVGRVQADGLIADAHLVDTFSFDTDAYADFRYYRLTNDGFLAAVGQEFDNETGDMSLAVLRYDLSGDPNFVNTANPAPVIDPTPLFTAVGGDGSWHVGETLGADPACGAMTLYGQTEGGFVRAFSAGVEIDTIVDVAVGDTRTIDFDDGSQFVSRTVVVQTECPASYQGRRVWFGTETDTVIWGLRFQQADLVEVTNVLSVRDVSQAGSDFVERSIIEIEYLDGSTADVELVALPFDG